MNMSDQATLSKSNAELIMALNNLISIVESQNKKLSNVPAYVIDTSKFKIASGKASRIALVYGDNSKNHDKNEEIKNAR